MKEGYAVGGSWMLNPTSLNSQVLAYAFIYDSSYFDQGIRLMVILTTKTINNGKDSNSRRV